MHAKKLRWAGAIALALVISSGACTLLVDKNSKQCESDADCTHFGNHPFCQNSVCVASGLNPRDCFFPTADQPLKEEADFLNQCGYAQCLSYDDCKKLKDCTSHPPPLDPRSVGGQPGAGGASATAGASSGGAGSGGASPDAVPALPSCRDANSGRGSVVYITGSSNFPPLLSKLVPLVDGFTPIYQITSSCTGVKTMYGSGARDRFIVDPTPSLSARYAQYFDQQQHVWINCTLGPDGAEVDVGESDIFSTSCSGYEASDTNPSIGQYSGPIQAMLFVVNSGSTENAISAEAARQVFGVAGNDANAPPWTNPALYFVRNAGTGTQQMIGRAIGVLADQFWGIDQGTAAAMAKKIQLLSNANDVQAAIGIISTDFYDADRTNLKALAFKATGQGCAYLPDSTPQSKDKRNVRDGHYGIWGPLHFFTPISNEGAPISAGATAFVSAVSKPVLDESEALLTAFIAASLVPPCAMMVQRNTELGTLSVNSQQPQCQCFFDATINAGETPAGCTTCKTSHDCVPPKPACHLGYCEVR